MDDDDGLRRYLRAGKSHARGATKVLHKPFDDITKIPDLVKDFLQ